MEDLQFNADLTVSIILQGLEDEGINQKISYSTLWHALLPIAFEQFAWIAMRPDYKVLLCYQFRTDAERIRYEHGNFDLPDPAIYGEAEIIKLTQQELDYYCNHPEYVILSGTGQLLSEKE